MDYLGKDGWGKQKKMGLRTRNLALSPKEQEHTMQKIEEIINREASKPDIIHIGGGSKTEITINTPMVVNLIEEWILHSKEQMVVFII